MTYATIEMELPDVNIDKNKEIKIVPTLFLKGASLPNDCQMVITKLYVTVEMHKKGKGYGYKIKNGILKFIGRKKWLHLEQDNGETTTMELECNR